MPILFSPNIEAIHALRLLQGLAGGMIIPLVMTTAFRILTSNIRAGAGLAVYALTATFTPALAATVAAFWTDIVDWRFVFLQTIPLCSLAGVLVWYCLHQDQPRYERFRMLDWRGALLLVIGAGALSTLLYQGDRLDWFNSRLICVLALVSAVAIPLLLVNEWFHPLPLLKLQMLGRRNFAYGTLALFTFLIISQSGSTVLFAIFAGGSGLQTAAIQPDHAGDCGVATGDAAGDGAAARLQTGGFAHCHAGRVGVDPRILHRLIVPDSLLEPGSILLYGSYFQAIGQPMVIMPLLLMTTNTVAGPAEGPFASALATITRRRRAAGAWFLGLIDRWRSALHYDRIVDQVGQDRWRVIQSTACCHSIHRR